MSASPRTLPADINAERDTLGACLLERDAIIVIAPWLSASAFYLEKHAWIYEALLACYEQGIPPDISTVADELRRLDRLDQVGGLLYLGELSASVPSAVHVEYYARIVKRTALLRRLVEAGGKIAALGYDEEDDITAVFERAEVALFDVTQDQGERSFVPVRTVADEFFEQFSQQQASRSTVSGVPTGYYDLDAMTGGLQRSDLIILAARPGMGKTALGLNMAINIASTRQPVAFFSLEMSRLQLFYRLLAMETGLDTQRLRTGKIADADLERLIAALGHLSDIPLYIDDTPALSVAEIRNRARRLRAQTALELIVVDYLQLARGGRELNRVQEVGEIARGLKELARTLDVPVLALSQLSRAVEGRVSHVPQLSDLRESGDIEQVADVVLFIYREELYDKDTRKKGTAEVHFAKHRNGPLGIVPLRFDARTTRFQNLERYHTSGQAPGSAAGWTVGL